MRIAATSPSRKNTNMVPSMKATIATCTIVSRPSHAASGMLPNATRRMMSHAIINLRRFTRSMTAPAGS